RHRPLCARYGGVARNRTLRHHSDLDPALPAALARLGEPAAATSKGAGAATDGTGPAPTRVVALAAADDIHERVRQSEPGAQRGATDFHAFAAPANPNADQSAGWILLEHVDAQQAITDIPPVIAEDGGRSAGCKRSDLPGGAAVEGIADPGQVAEMRAELRAVVPSDESELTALGMPAVGGHVEGGDELPLIGQHLAAGSINRRIRLLPLVGQSAVRLIGLARPEIEVA